MKEKNPIKTLKPLFNGYYAIFCPKIAIMFNLIFPMIFLGFSYGSYEFARGWRDAIKDSRCLSDMEFAPPPCVRPAPAAVMSHVMSHSPQCHSKREVRPREQGSQRKRAMRPRTYVPPRLGNWRLRNRTAAPFSSLTRPRVDVLPRSATSPPLVSPPEA